MIDEAHFEARAGNGGNGMVAFLREAMRPMGGPSGGNGGNGGSVILVANDSLNTLLKFRWRRHFIAGHGRNGEQNKRHGASGNDIEVTIPIGTEVWEIAETDTRDANSDEPQQRQAFLGDLVSNGQRMTVAHGGRGGLGNAASVTAINREPKLAEAGEAGETTQIRLNLKLLADVGIIGMPNAGKSSLLAAISAAQPKIADYPFTTIEPVIGMVQHGFDAFAAVDIPGLIEGAADGAGLGHTFLKHIQRTRLLLHLVDGSAPDIAANIKQVNAELEQFDPLLAAKPQMLVINKSDTEEVRVLRQEIESEARRAIGNDAPIRFISAATHTGLEELVAATAYAIKDAKRTSSTASDSSTADIPLQTLINQSRDMLTRYDLPVIRPRGSERPAIKLTDGAFRIMHKRAVRIANGSNLNDWDTQVQYHKRLVQMNIAHALTRLGIKTGDTVRAGEWEFAWP